MHRFLHIVDMYASHILIQVSLSLLRDNPSHLEASVGMFRIAESLSYDFRIILHFADVRFNKVTSHFVLSRGFRTSRESI